MSALASQCAQNCSDEKNFADSGEMCSGNVPRPGTCTGSGTGKAGQRPQHIIHVGLADQVSLYNHQICHIQCLTSPEVHGKR